MLLVAWQPQPAVGGPPMITDDTATVGADVLEVIAFAAVESRDSVDSAQVPGLDLAFGLNDSLEIDLIFAWQLIEEAGESTQTGWGTVTMGTKWRFLDREQWSLAISPLVTLPVSSSSAIRGLVTDTTILSLPLIATFRRGAWQLDANLSYQVSSNDFETVFYGLSAGFAVSDRLRLSAEAWGIDYVDDESEFGFSNWRLGIELRVSNSLTILGAFGGGISSQLSPENQLNSDYYLGLRGLVFDF